METIPSACDIHFSWTQGFNTLLPYGWVAGIKFTEHYFYYLCGFFPASFKSCLGLVATKLASILATSQRSLSSLADRCRVSNLGVSAINRCILCGQHSLASFSVCPLVFIQYYFCFFFGFFCYLHAARFYEYLWCALRSPEPNAKCAFWVKLYHKPRAACKAK